MQIHLVTGGAGFLGSHLIDRLMEAGDEVICLDNYLRGVRPTSRAGLAIHGSN
jgi:UDP-glucuronate decarboxylase